MELMDEFFASRADIYDEHMLNNVTGCREAYKEMARLIPDSCANLLDLGCGTGLELDEIFKVKPHLKVTGIDLTQAMLDKLSVKHGDKNLKLICGSYFDIPLGNGEFDCAISFQTLHHFTKHKKAGLYKKLYESLKQGGLYIECDYMVIRQEDEELFFSEYSRLRAEQNIPEDEFYHYDTPCTLDNQIKLLRDAGFHGVEKKFRIENTTILTAIKF
ncbi:MAG: class I SAM-dependent methyltransferase [Eubacteriales bacterium]